MDFTTKAAYMMEEGGADVVQMPKQSEKTAAQFVVPDLCNTKAEQSGYICDLLEFLFFISFLYFLTIGCNFGILIYLQATFFHLKTFVTQVSKRLQFAVISTNPSETEGA